MREVPRVSARISAGGSLSPRGPPRGAASSPEDALAPHGLAGRPGFRTRRPAPTPPFSSRSRQRGGAGHLETKRSWKSGLRMRRVSATREPPVLPPPTSAPFPCPRRSLTPVQGVSADLGRRHQFQIKSPEPHGHQGERQQQPEAPPQQLDRAQEQQEQRGPGAPHGLAPRLQPPALDARHPAPAPLPGPAPRARGGPAPAQGLRAEPRPSPPSCSRREGSLPRRGRLAPPPRRSLSASRPGASSPECPPRPALLSTPLLVAGSTPPARPPARLLARSLARSHTAHREASLGARPPASPPPPARDSWPSPSRDRTPTCPAPAPAPPPGPRWAPPLSNLGEEPLLTSLGQQKMRPEIDWRLHRLGRLGCWRGRVLIRNLCD